MRRPHPKRLGRPAAGSRIACILAVLVACGALIALAADAAAQPQPSPSRAEARVLRGGWFPLDPYQYREYRRGTAVLTGYDIEIERALGRILGVDIQLPEVVWEEHLAAVAAGKADLAAGATFSEERNRYAYFSKPYRQETDVLVLRRGAGARYRFNDVAQMLEAFERQHFRLGVIAGFTYASDRVNAYIADPAHDATIVKVGDDTENLRNLLAGVIDGFIADRIVAATVAWRQQKAGEIEEYPLYMTTPIHFMLSRASQSPAMLDRLNGAIDDIRRTGEIKHIADTYALPILIHQTLDANWFKALALLGTIAFTLSGVVLAHAGKYTLFGALVLASIPALGGGVLRDLIVQREPLGVVRDPMFVLAVIATVLLGMAFFKLASFGRAGRLVEPLRARRALGTPSHRGVRRAGARRLHRARRRRHPRHFGPSAVAVGSDLRRDRQLVRRPDPRHDPPGRRAREPQGSALPRDRGGLGPRLLAVPRLGGRSAAAGGDLARRRRHHRRRVSHPDGRGRVRPEGLAVCVRKVVHAGGAPCYPSRRGKITSGGNECAA